MLSEDGSGEDDRDITEEAEGEILNDRKGGKYWDNATFDSKKARKIFLTVMLVILLTIVIMLVVLLMQSPKQGYPTYNQIIQKLSQAVTMLSPYIHIRTQLIGQSVEKRNIILLKMSPKALNSSLAGEDCHHPLVWVVCGVHAREWTSPLTCLSFIEKLGDIFVNTASEDGDDILRSLQFNILVVANPDGYQYSMSLPTRRLTRKNRRKSSCPDSSLAGVDINRNFGSGYNYGDDCYGQVCPFNATPCSITHGGEKPFSEPETRVVRDAMTAEVPWLSLSLHGNGNSWSSPFAYKIADPPPNVGSKWDLEFLAKKIFNKFGTSYRYGSSSGVMYRAGGTMIDWVYEGLGVLRSYNHELRNICPDHDTALCIFQPEVQLALDYIVPEAWWGFKELVKNSYMQDCQQVRTIK